MFVKLDIQKMRVESGTPANPAKAAKLSGDEKAEQGKISRISRFSSVDPSNLHFFNDCDGHCRTCRTPCGLRAPAEQGAALPPGPLPCLACSNRGQCSKPGDQTVSMGKLCACDGTSPGRAIRAQYPDDQRRVKCSYCVHLDLSAIRAVCRKSKQEKTGISLLTTCPDFIMRGTLAGKTGA